MFDGTVTEPANPQTAGSATIWLCAWFVNANEFLPEHAAGGFVGAAVGGAVGGMVGAIVASGGPPCGLGVPGIAEFVPQPVPTSNVTTTRAKPRTKRVSIEMSSKKGSASRF